MEKTRVPQEIRFSLEGRGRLGTQARGMSSVYVGLREEHPR